MVRADLLAYDYDAAIKMFSRNTLVASQKNLLNKQFLANGYMSALASHRGFAKCFMTAEWLFDSLKQSAGFIDLTAISMGYFKAIEQFMYDFVGLHTSEKDGKRREMPFFNDQGEYWLHFTDALYTDKKKSITLGNLAKFFKNRNNLDLLSNGLDTTIPSSARSRHSGSNAPGAAIRRSSAKSCTAYARTAHVRASAPPPNGGGCSTRRSESARNAAAR